MESGWVNPKKILKVGITIIILYIKPSDELRLKPGS